MNALEKNGNHETSSLHKEEVVLQACQIKEWHHIIFVNADSSSSIIRQTWKVLFSYHMARHHFPFISGVALLASAEALPPLLQETCKSWENVTERATVSAPGLIYSRCTFQSHLLFVYVTNQRKIESLSLHERESYMPSLSILNYPATTSAIFVFKCETLREL